MSQENVAPELEQVETPEPVEQTSETPSESGTEENVGEDQNTESVPSEDGEQDTEVEDKKPKDGFTRRIAKLTTKQKEAEQEAAYWRKIALEAQGKPAAVGTDQPSEKKPVFSDYNDIEQYTEAMSDWKAEKAVQKALSQRDQQQGVRSVQQSYQSRVNEFKKVTPDFDEVFEDLEDVQLPPEVVNAVMESDVGPALAYHLAKNLETVQRLNSLPPYKRLIELGKLEERLEKKAPATEAPAKKISSAPAPQKAPKGSSTAQKAEDQMSPEEWIAYRNKTVGRR